MCKDYYPLAVIASPIMHAGQSLALPTGKVSNLNLGFGMYRDVPGRVEGLGVVRLN